MHLGGPDAILDHQKIHDMHGCNNIKCPLFCNMNASSTFSHTKARCLGPSEWPPLLYQQPIAVLFNTVNRDVVGQTANNHLNCRHGHDEVVGVVKWWTLIVHVMSNTLARLHWLCLPMQGAHPPKWAEPCSRTTRRFAKSVFWWTTQTITFRQVAYFLASSRRHRYSYAVSFSGSASLP